VSPFRSERFWYGTHLLFVVIASGRQERIHEVHCLEHADECEHGLNTDAVWSLMTARKETAA
jgi:hypothetical protein